MIKNNKWKAIISSIIILLPVIFGFIMWDRLPDTMTTHWGADGVADGHSGKIFSVLFIPFFLLAMHWICLIITAWDNQNRNQTRKAEGLVFWIMPCISLFVNSFMYSVALGAELNMSTLVFLFLGALFAITGNYLPKVKQNRTLGIKIKWTLESEANWNATHRFAGKLWVVGGIFFIPFAFLPEKTVVGFLFVFIIVLVAIPTVYSYRYHKKEKEQGKIDEMGESAESMTGTIGRKGTVILSAVLVLILAGVAFLMFTGNVRVQYGEESFAVKADYWGDITVRYDSVNSIEFIEDFDKGIRTYGFGSARLSLGRFESDELGKYTLYAYTQCDAAVILKVDGKTLVINAEDEKSTESLYGEFLRRIEKGESK